MSNIVGERYQITIDKEVRGALGVKPGDRAIERVEDGRLVVTFMPAPHRRSLLGVLRQEGQPPITDWQTMKDQVWRVRAEELCGSPRANRKRTGDRRQP